MWPPWNKLLLSPSPPKTPNQKLTKWETIGPDSQGVPSRRTRQYPVLDYAFIEGSNLVIGESVVFDSEARKEFSEYVRFYRIKSWFWFAFALFIDQGIKSPLDNFCHSLKGNSKAPTMNIQHVWIDIEQFFLNRRCSVRLGDLSNSQELQQDACWESWVQERGLEILTFRGWRFLTLLSNVVPNYAQGLLVFFNHCL